MSDILQCLSGLTPYLRGELRTDESLSRYTTWRIGGVAQAFVCPEDLDDIRATLRYVYEAQLPLFVLGRGSNLLVDDEGVPGITLYMAKTLQGIQISDSVIRVGGGVSLPALAKTVSKLGFTGFEFLVGIPGTVGAGVLINAGAGGHEIKDILEVVSFLDCHGVQHTISNSELQLRYRESALRRQPVIVIGASFRLEHRDEPEKIEKRLHEYIAKRRQKFPLNFPNAGSVFKRPDEGTGPHAGWLSETAGMKGFRIGDAQVSEIHANFIVNLGKATAQDVRAVIEEVHNRVMTVHGISLEREVVFWPEEGR